MTKEESLNRVLAMVKPGQDIYCVMRHVSESGLMRRISLYTIHNGQLYSLDGLTSTLTGRPLSSKGGVVCRGVGMDMGYDLVHTLSYALWPQLSAPLRHVWL